MGAYHRKKLEPAKPIAIPKPIRKVAFPNLETMDWKAKFFVAVDALLKMECRAEIAEMELERLTGRPPPWKR